MNTATLSAALLVSLLVTGCGKQATPPASSASVAAPVAQPALAAWEQGEKATAISSFVQADWSSRPLFASTSVLSLSEDQFQALPEPQRQAKGTEATAQLNSFKQLVAAVAQAGRDAATKGDTAQARKHFDALKQCGAALAGPDCLSLVQLVGKTVQKMGDSELAKLKP